MKGKVWERKEKKEKGGAKLRHMDVYNVHVVNVMHACIVQPPDIWWCISEKVSSKTLMFVFG